MKIKFEFEFANDALYEDFLEAAANAGLSPEDYVVLLIERGLDNQPQADGGQPDAG